MPSADVFRELTKLLDQHVKDTTDDAPGTLDGGRRGQNERQVRDSEGDHVVNQGSDVHPFGIQRIVQDDGHVLGGAQPRLESEKLWEHGGACVPDPTGLRASPGT